MIIRHTQQAVIINVYPEKDALYWEKDPLCGVIKVRLLEATQPQPPVPLGCEQYSQQQELQMRFHKKADLVKTISILKLALKGFK